MGLHLRLPVAAHPGAHCVLERLMECPVWEHLFTRDRGSAYQRVNPSAVLPLASHNFVSAHHETFHLTGHMGNLSVTTKVVTFQRALCMNGTKPRTATIRAKHGLDFADAEQVFADRCVTFVDDHFDYGEQRLMSLGTLAGRLVVMAHSLRGQKIYQKRRSETWPAQGSGHRLFGDPAAGYLIFQEGDRSLATGKTTNDSTSRRGCARLAQNAWEGLSDAAEPHPMRSHGTPGSVTTTDVKES